MRQIVLTVSYDGTHYAGYQIQKNARTIQAVLESTLRRILKEKVRLSAASRTDAGVHALEHITAFKSGATISCVALMRALNSLLPQDIVVRKAAEKPPSFRVRDAAALKQYRYTIRHHPVRSPFDRFYTTFYPYPLDVAAMRKAARYLVGRKNFKSFQASDKVERSSVRTIHRLSVRQKSPYLVIDVTGSGFLYKMVRNIVGTLLEVGRGRRLPEGLPRLVSQKNRTLAGPTAPARGLCLIKVSNA
ncbi:MAG: tRNA pseudouridine(38-40) synthase TruA [Candidatus Omnitrophota bacterium]